MLRIAGWTAWADNLMELRVILGLTKAKKIPNFFFFLNYFFRKLIFFQKLLFLSLHLAHGSKTVLFEHSFFKCLLSLEAVKNFPEVCDSWKELQLMIHIDFLLTVRPNT